MPFAFVLLLFITAGSLPESCSSQPEAAVTVLEQISWRDLSNEELISHLPVAQEEIPYPRRRHGAIDPSLEHPASAELRARIAAGSLADTDWISAVRHSKLIAFHERWPEDRPLEVSLRSPLWLGSSGAVRITPRLEGAAGRRRSFSATYAMPRESITIGALPPGTRDIMLDLELFSGPMRHVSRPVWKGTLSYPIVTVESVADSIEPVSDPRFDAAVKEAISIRVDLNRDAPRPTMALWMTLQHTGAARPYLEQHSCRAVVEVIDGTSIIDEFIIDFRRAEWAGLCNYYRDTLDERVLRDPDLGDRVTLRITGSSNVAFTDLRRKSYWSGQIVAPLHEFLRTDPPRPLRRVPDSEGEQSEATSSLSGPASGEP